MRICFVSIFFLKDETTSIDGVQVKTYQLATGFVKLGWEVKYISATNQKDKVGTAEIQNGFEIYWLPHKMLFGVLDFWRIWKALSWADADVYYQRSRSFITGIVGKFCRLKRRIFAWASAGEGGCSKFKYSTQKKSSYKKNFLKKLIKLTDAYIKDYLYHYGIDRASFTIHDTNTQMKQAYEVFGKKGFVLGSGHPIPHLKQKTEPPIVCWVSAIKPDKQPEIFLKIVERCKDMHAQFVMAGEIRDSSYLPKIREVENKVKNFQFMGKIDFDESNHLIAKSSVFVNTTSLVNKIGGESIANTFIQSWLNRVPTTVLLCDPDNVIKRNKLGFHSASFEQLVSDVKFLIENPQIREKIGENARRYAITSHDINKVAKSHEKIFLRAIRLHE